MKKVITVQIIITLLFLSINCDSFEPDRAARIELKAVDASVTETFLKIRMSLPGKNEIIELQRNGKTIMSFPAVSDTTVADTALTENTQYTYRLTVREGNRYTYSGREITIRTLSPSSHHISWEVYDVGDAIGTQLFDVAISGPNEVWAAGSFYKRDSLGNLEESHYNAARWDGKEWKHLRIYASDYFFTDSLLLSMTGIHAFSPNDIWFTGGFVVHMLKGSITAKLLQPHYYEPDSSRKPIWTEGQYPTTIWGESIYDIYAAGTNGALAHYNGNWSNIRTDCPETQIMKFSHYYDLDEKLNLLLPALDNYRKHNALLRVYDVRKISRISWPPEQPIYSAWSNKGYPVYCCGDTLVSNKTGRWRKIPGLPEDFVPLSVDGTGLNDIFCVGFDRVAAHYNGKDWKIYDELKLDPVGAYPVVRIKYNLVVILGNLMGRQVVIIGRR